MIPFFKFLNEQYKLNPSSNTDDFCGPASLQAFGVCIADREWVMKIHEIENELKNAGYKVESQPKYPFRGYTLGQFMKEFPKGSFILATSKHVVAYIDGVLTDTNHTKRALSKKLEAVLEVKK